jgi:hypothetical protein
MAWMGQVQIADRNGASRSVGVPNFRALNGRQIWDRWMEFIRASLLDRQILDAIIAVDRLVREGPASYEFHSGDAKVEESLQALAELVAKVEDELHVTIKEFLHDRQ